MFHLLKSWLTRRESPALRAAKARVREAHTAWTNARARGDTRGQHTAWHAFRDAKTAQLRLEMGR